MNINRYSLTLAILALGSCFSLSLKAAEFPKENSFTVETFRAKYPISDERNDALLEQYKRPEIQQDLKPIADMMSPGWENAPEGQKLPFLKFINDVTYETLPGGIRGRLSKVAQAPNNKILGLITYFRRTNGNTASIEYFAVNPRNKMVENALLKVAVDYLTQTKNPAEPPIKSIDSWAPAEYKDAYENNGFKVKGYNQTKTRAEFEKEIKRFQN